MLYQFHQIFKTILPSILTKTCGNKGESPIYKQDLISIEGEIHNYDDS